MTSERLDDSEREEAEREEETSDALVERADVQNALAVEGDLPEGARGGMDQAAQNAGSRTRPSGEETSDRQDEPE